MGAARRAPLLLARLGMLCGLLLAAGCLISRAAAAVDSASDYLIDTWQKHHGLPQGAITALTQTSDGYLWVATPGALTRFDGERFVTFWSESTPELQSGELARLHGDRRGNLWIGTRDGALVSYRAGVFVVHAAERAWGGRITVFDEDRYGRFWVATSQGRIVCWENEQPRMVAKGPELREQAVIKLEAEAKGDVWALTAAGQLYRIRGGVYEIISAQWSLLGERCAELAQDAQGQIWIGTERELAVWKDSGVEAVPRPSGLPALAVTGCTPLPDGSLWIEANERLWKGGAGLALQAYGQWPPNNEAMTCSHLGRSGALWQACQSKKLLRLTPDGKMTWLDLSPAADPPTCLYEDWDGNLWAGTASSGLLRLRPRRFASLPGEGLSEASVTVLAQTRDQALWIGTYDQGLYRWRDGNIARFNLGLDESPGYIRALCEDGRNRLWAGTRDNGVFEWRGEAWVRPFPPEAIGHQARVIFEDARGRVWFGNGLGVYCWESGRLTSYTNLLSTGAADIRSAAEDRSGALWFGSMQSGLYRCRNGQFTRFTRAEGLAHDSVLALHAGRDGTLWIGTIAGLSQYRDGRFINFTAKDGLPSVSIRFITEDEQGHLWLGTLGGVVCVRQAELDAAAPGPGRRISWVLFDEKDGMPAQECTGGYQPAGCRLRDGRICWPTPKGVAIVQPAGLALHSTPPRVTIEEILVDGELRRDVPVSAAAVAPAPALDIPPGKQRLEFRFTAPNLSAPGKTRFKYRLAGLDLDWVEAGARRSAPYSHLPPGQYRFEVAACNEAGVWSAAETGLNLRVLPYFWQTWWFAGLALASGTSLVAGLGRLVATRRWRRKLAQSERERALERERARIAQDIHDDLGASLTQIALLSELAQGSLEHPQDTREHINQIFTTAQQLTRALDEIVWAINPKNDTLDSLVTYLCRFAQQYLRTAGVRCRLDVPRGLAHRPVSAEARHHLFLVCKEALNNVVKHAAATEVRLRLVIEPGRLRLTIEDNGRGFSGGASAERLPDVERATGGHGLANMQQRLRDLGGVFQVESKAGQGAKIILEMPLAEGEAPAGNPAG